MNKKKTYIITGVFITLLLVSALLYKQLANGFKNEEAFEPQSESELAKEEAGTSQSFSLEGSEFTGEAIAPTVLPDNNSNTADTSDAVTDTANEKSKSDLSSLNEKSGKEDNITSNSSNKSDKVTTDKASSVAPTTTPEIPSNTVAPTKPPVQISTPIPTSTPLPTSTPAPTSVPVNKNTATNFTVYDSNGNAVSLSDYFGKPIVVNFWASWCGPCKSEMPGFDRMYQQYKGSVSFLMVDMVDGYRETKETGQSYIANNGYSFPVFYDTKQSASYAYSVTSYPTTLFIDANGNIAKIKKGAMSESTLENEINALLH